MAPSGHRGWRSPATAHSAAKREARNGHPLRERADDNREWTTGMAMIFNRKTMVAMEGLGPGGTASEGEVPRRGILHAVHSSVNFAGVCALGEQSPSSTGVCALRRAIAESHRRLSARRAIAEFHRRLCARRAIAEFHRRLCARRAIAEFHRRRPHKQPHRRRRNAHRAHHRAGCREVRFLPPRRLHRPRRHRRQTYPDFFRQPFPLPNPSPSSSSSCDRTIHSRPA